MHFSEHIFIFLIILYIYLFINLFIYIYTSQFIISFLIFESLILCFYLILKTFHNPILKSEIFI